MMQVLDDDQLESLQCAKCHKYLSVFPVKNHVTREVTCGRCSSDDDDGVRSALYELIAERYLFRCVNRYEGCRKLLRMDETEAHERECIGNVFTCPKCQDSTKRSVLELIWHYKLGHPTSYLRSDSFERKVPTEDVMLYIQDDVVFFISLCCKLGSSIMCLSAMTLVEVNATQSFLISKESLFEKTEKKPCKSICALKHDPFIIDLNSEVSVKIIFNLEVLKTGSLYHVSVPSMSKELISVSNQLDNEIQLTEELKNYLEYTLNDKGTALVNKLGYRISLTCSNCKELIGPTLFRCIKLRHRICYHCHTWCGLCNCAVVQCNSSDQFTEIYSTLRFPCKWECGGYFTSDLRTHESACRLSFTKCPECSAVIHLKLVARHLFNKHHKHFSEAYHVDEIMKFIHNEAEGEVYFLLNDKWCRLKWQLIWSDKYDLKYTLVFDEANTKLGIVHSNSTFSYDCLTSVHISTIPSYKPYLNFNFK